ncbi:MAG: LCP family protein [Clostridiales bacterium]|nr:LCP family protein [Clostridiales bacterium]
MKKKAPPVTYTHVDGAARTASKPPRRKKGTGKRALVFLATLLLCLLLFGLIGFFLLRDQLFPPADPSAGDTAAVSEQQSVPAPMNLLIIQTADKDGLPRFWLTRFLADPGSVTITALPAETMVESAGRQDRLSGYLSYGGVSSASQAVADLCGVTVDRTVRMSPEQLEGVIDQFGGVIYTVPRRLEEYDAEGNLTVSLSAGRQSLTGAHLRQLFAYRGWEEGRGRQIAVQQEAAASFFNQCLTAYNLGQAESNFLYLVNHSETNLSRADFDAWLPWYQKMAGTSPAGVMRAEGTYDNSGSRTVFTMTETQRALLGGAYGNESP